MRKFSGVVMFDFVEETLDEVSVSVEVRAEGRYVLAVRHGFDVGPRAAFVEASPQLIAVVGTVGQKSPIYEIIP